MNLPQLPLNSKGAPKLKTYPRNVRRCDKKNPTAVSHAPLEIKVHIGIGWCWFCSMFFKSQSVFLNKTKWKDLLQPNSILSPAVTEQLFWKLVYRSPLKLPWWGRAPSNCRGTLSFLYKMGGPGWRHLYKMECAKKTLENDRAPTYTGDSWWIEKFEAISIMFGGHMSIYKNKDSFCRHVPGLQNE